MNATLTERRIEAGETSERVAFTCPGCGRETVIHVGLATYLPEKRCMQCRGTPRAGRGGNAVVKGKRIGTHEGRRKDRKDGTTADQQRAVKRAASARNRSRRAGYRLSNGEVGRKPCRSYDECNHRKHRYTTGRR